MSELNVIEKGIPIPTRTRAGSCGALLRQLEIGDSFVSDTKRDGIYATATRIGIKVRTKTLEDKTTRIWRIA